MWVSPFKFGKVVEGSQFTNRQTEINRLINNFQSGINTILISPRRWGKTSLVKQVSKKRILQTSKKYKFIFIDLFTISSEEEFYKMLAEAALKSTSSKMKDWISASQKFLKKLSPKISVNVEGVDISLDFHSEDLLKNHKTILDITEKIAKDKKIKMIVCIDEFQNIERFPSTLKIQQRLRSTWQQHQNVTYCLYGSKRGMMMNMFEKETKPFYKFGDVLYLEKLAEKHAVPFVIKQFEKTGKTIGSKQAKEICTLMKGHPYYIQQLSHLVWTKTENQVNDEIVNEAKMDLITQNALFFEQMCDGLSNAQINFLKALGDGNKAGFYNDEIRRKYKLGSSGNISKIKSKLYGKEIIDITQHQIAFLDPAFELWFTTFYRTRNS